MNRLRELGQRIDAREAHVGIIGLGYVGLPLAIEFVRAGFKVTGFELDASKAAAIQDGTSYIEDVPTEQVAEARESGRLTATTDTSTLSSCDVINVCVPTPLTRTKDPDVSFIALALEEIRKRIHAGQIVILGSTTYPGTTQELIIPMLEATGLSVGVDFAVAFAPERIDPANKQFQVREIPKVVGGATPLCTELAVKLFRHIFDEVVPVSSTQSAEMVKRPSPTAS
jgi:UDP-N-acetyl-D-glucosamine dehydrogenase